MSDSLGSRFRISQELHEPTPLHAAFVARVLDAGFAEFNTQQWATSERSLEGLGPPLMRATSQAGDTVVVEADGTLLLVTLGGSFVYAHAAADDADAAAAAVARVRELLPPPEPSAAQEVPVMFWTYSAHGPIPSMRKISVLEWAEIQENYTAETRRELDRLMRDFRPAHGGQLILWHGDVGTGKTFALRALAWEWREWCQVHYIVDPDTFFGEHADYLMAVLMQSGGLGAHVGMMMASHPAMTGGGWTSYSPLAFAEEVEEDEAVGPDDDEDPVARRLAPQWRLLVLEDTGELLRPDAKSIIGQGLSRFLNVVDGLIGQGLRVLVLVTTNEELGTLHPAVSRPGRAAANVEFPPLTAEEAAAWLEQHGVDAAAAAATNRSLASLYALLEGRDPADTRIVGFGET